MADSGILSLNISKRMISGLILSTLMLYIIYIGGEIFQFVVVLASILMAFEWYALISHAKNNVNRSAWKAFGCLYIGIPSISLIWLIYQNQGQALVAWLMLTVWVSDTMAYVSGKAIGGPKFFRRISPNKTWAGFCGAIISAVGVGVIASKYFQSDKPLTIISLTVLLAIYAQLGDLLESYIKRYFNVKDSGRLIPGHGGILDRVDGMVLTAPTVVLALLIFKNIF